jgi:hypothetical protein
MLMMIAAVASSLRAPAIRPMGLALGVPRRALDLRHDGDAGLEPGQAQRQLGEHDQGDADHDQRVAVLARQRRGPVSGDRGVPDDVAERDRHDHGVESQVDADQCDRDTDRLGEALQEDRPQHRQQYQRDQHLMPLQ